MFLPVLLTVSWAVSAGGCNDFGDFCDSAESLGGGEDVWGEERLLGGQGRGRGGRQRRAVVTSYEKREMAAKVRPPTPLPIRYLPSLQIQFIYTVCTARCRM